MIANAIVWSTVAVSVACPFAFGAVDHWHVLSCVCVASQSLVGCVGRAVVLVPRVRVARAPAGACAPCVCACGAARLLRAVRSLVARPPLPVRLGAVRACPSFVTTRRLLQRCLLVGGV